MQSTPEVAQDQSVKPDESIDLKAEVAKSPLLGATLFHLVGHVGEMEKSVGKLTKQAIKDVIGETKAEVEALRARAHFLLEKHIVVSEVCYSIRRSRPPDALELALGAVIAMDWQDEWWNERLAREREGSVHLPPALSVKEWERDIRKEMHRQMSGVAA